MSLTHMQEGLLFHFLKRQEIDHYLYQVSLKLSGNIDIKLFQKAWDFVIDTNEMLRTVFYWQSVKQPIQIVLKKSHLTFHFFDFSGRESGDIECLLKEIKEKDTRDQCDLCQVPFRIILCKIQKDKYELIITYHHIILDGWSTGIILKEFFNAYNCFIYNQEPEKVTKMKFKEYLKWIRSRDMNRQKEFWRDYLEDFNDGSEIVFKKKIKNHKRVADRLHLKLDRDIQSGLEHFTREYKITLATIFYCTWGLLLQRYKHTNDVIFGITVSGRSAKITDIENMVGLFMNTLPLRIKIHADERIWDLLIKINKILQVLKEYEWSSLTDIKDTIDMNREKALFDSVVAFENYPLDKKLMLENQHLSLESFFMNVYEMSHFDLTLGIALFENGIEVAFGYDKSVYRTGTIVEMSKHFLIILRDIIYYPDKKIDSIEIISPDKKKEIVDMIHEKNKKMRIDFDL